MGLVSVVIVNYNRKDLLKKCLDSLRNQSFKDIEVIVIDNGSSDGSSEFIKERYPEVKLAENAANLFFCKPNNYGIKLSGGDFVLCLNNDCVLDRDYLKEAVSCFNIDKKIGMVSGKILRTDGKTIDSTGLFIAKNRKPLERGYGRIDTGKYEKLEYVFGVSGSCALFKRDMLDDIKDENGYFDETFEIYYEDLDLCWRAQKKGWKAYYNPKAIAYHERGATAIIRNHRGGFKTFPYIADELKRKYIRNRYKCMKKNDSFEGVLLNLPFILLYEIKIYLYMVWKFSLDHFKKA